MMLCILWAGVVLVVWFSGEVVGFLGVGTRT